MKRTIRMEKVYPCPPERLWRALTDPQALAEWLMPNDFQPKLGHKFQFRTQPRGRRFNGIIDCEVTELDRPKRLAYSWVGGGSHWQVTWTLEPVAEGTRLRLEHAGFEGAREIGISLIMQAGWKKMLAGRLAALLSNPPASPSLSRLRSP